MSSSVIWELETYDSYDLTWKEWVFISYAISETILQYFQLNLFTKDPLFYLIKLYIFKIDTLY